MSMYLSTSGRRDVATCSVCLKNSQKYETLPCDHRFCEGCVNQQISRLSSVRDYETVSIVCPYCRDFFLSKIAFLIKGSKKSQKRQTVDFSPMKRDRSYTEEAAKRCQPCAEMREYTPSTFWCHNCSEYMCSMCAHYHSNMKMSMRHVVKTLRDKERYGDVKPKIYDEYKASRTPPQQRKRPESSRYKCEPCGQSRKTVDAKYSCQNCSERMCEECAKCHRSMKMSKSHKVIKLSDMEIRKSATFSGGAFSDGPCDRHYGETQSLYCKRCKTSCCSICAISLHSNCGPTSKLPSKSTKDKLNDNYFTSLSDGKTRYPYRSESNERNPKDREVAFGSILKQTKDDKSVAIKTPRKDAKDAKEPKVKIAKNRMENRKSRINFGSGTPGDWVISMALLTSGDILLTELHQRTLKMIDASGTLLSTCTFYGEPWSVAVYNDSLAAVTFSDRKQFQLVKIDHYGGLTVGKMINTSHKSLGICFAKDLIVTSCWEGCLHVYNITGKELCSIDKDNYGDRLFSSPEYLATNRMGTTIYVTDYRRDTVTALKLLPNKIDNKPEFVFTNKDLQGPKGIAVDRYGVLYVAGMSSRNIFRLSPGGDLVQVYRRRADTEYYEALAVNTTGEKMYVSAYEDNTILVMKMST